MESVFQAQRDSMFESISVTLQFSDRLVGGIPKDPKLIQGWIRKNMGITNELEVFEKTKQTLVESGVTVPEDATFEDLMKASDEIAEEIKTQGFKRTADGVVYIESRQVKAGIKESVNILFGAEKWGPTRKGARGYTAERVFIKPDLIIPDGDPTKVNVDLAIGHITGPKGPQSTIGYYEYLTRPIVSFNILQLRNQNKPPKKDGESEPNNEPALSFAQWAAVWAHMELNGLGSMRSQGFGQFDVIAFDIDGRIDDELLAQARLEAEEQKRLDEETKAAEAALVEA